MASQSQKPKRDRGEVLHSVSKRLTSITTGKVHIQEETVSHYEKTFYCKFYEKKNGNKLKIEVIAPGAGGTYTLKIKKNDDPIKVTEHTKTELMKFIKGQKELAFMTDYIGKSKVLARTTTKKKSKSKAKKTKTKSKAKKTKTKSKSKAKKTKTKSKSKAKKTKSKGKKSRSKGKKTRSKSKSKSRSKMSRTKKTKKSRKTKKSKSKGTKKTKRSKSKSKGKKSKSKGKKSKKSRK
jgi:hypothetical protein